MDIDLLKTEAIITTEATDDYCIPTFRNNSNTVYNDNNRKNKSSVVKRPMNAFLLWARGERKRISSNGCGISQTSLSKFLGEIWR